MLRKSKIEILKTLEIKDCVYNRFITEDKVLQELIDNFAKVLESNINREDLKLFYTNISTLKIENQSILFEKIIGLFKDNTTTGQYYLEDNVISVLPLKSKNFLSKYIGISIHEYIANIYHELLHMASTIVDKEKNIIFSGLSQIGKNNIGIALDDAYTEILLYRYFNLNKEYMSYDYEVEITNLIEQIVGATKMTTMYFNANLYDLVETLTEYNTKENIIKFLEDLDSIYVLCDHSKKYQKDIIYYHNEIAKFLVDTYINKLMIDLEENTAVDQYNILLDNYINKIHVAFAKLEIEDKKKVRER